MVPVDARLTDMAPVATDAGALAIIVVTADVERWRAAVAIAQANAALGRRTALYLHDAATGLLAEDDAAIAGMLEMGVRLVACQTGLAALGLALPPEIEAGGLVSFLAETGEERVIAV
ncbi:peroxiredoxin [Sphingomonas sp. S1-29]|uniref:peroxiredoxin n=1 Tax=Sphingomonas sp. S1-29 TaxID=2991074 RepID=UPI0022405A00|nr:peroxiredoxin [Sphingomonas sp. S1-29]UZK69500.1 peroxiredoxin [Sphingomonas sp. S1-29]